VVFFAAVVDFFANVFFAAAISVVAEVFFAADFLAGVFLTGGPFAALASISAMASSRVIVAASSVGGIVAFTAPCFT